MRADTERRVIAFIRSVADKCTTCLRRSEDNCRNCISKWANSIMVDIEAEGIGESKHIDYSLCARAEKIMMILSRANRPLLSCEIDLNGLCSMQLKYWTLRKLCKLKKICRKSVRAGNRKHYLYSVNKKETINENNITRDRKL